MKLRFLIIIFSFALSFARAEGRQTITIEDDSLRVETLSVKTKKNWKPRANRIDREINKVNFAYKGEIATGINASYTTISSSESSLLTVLDDISASGTITSIKPFFGYFYKNNRYLGVRFGYDYIKGEIDSAVIDLGESNDMTFDIPYINYESHKYNFSVFHRSYTGLDEKGRFGLFAEVALTFATGNTKFIYENGGTLNLTSSYSKSLELAFNPGIAVFIFPNVCSTLSFGLGGLSYSDIEQKDDLGQVVGTRTASKLNLEFNILDINIGMVIHLWKKK